MTTMKPFIILITLLFAGIRSQAQDMVSLCQKINVLNDQILHNSIAKGTAKKEFKDLMAQLPKAQSLKASWVFPLKGYKSSAIGGVNGNGYSDKGYSYFDGNKHVAHPAHDIFINDRDQDCLDDRTHQAVVVVTVADGIVLACTDEWNERSDLRGGRYIWIYHPALNLITYYAHNRAVIVKPGQQVKQGQQIAEVGRTGYNAFKKRSPTHLHFGSYHLVNGLPVPFNSYHLLTKAS